MTKESYSKFEVSTLNQNVSIAPVINESTYGQRLVANAPVAFGLGSMTAMLAAGVSMPFIFGIHPPTEPLEFSMLYGSAIMYAPLAATALGGLFPNQRLLNEKGEHLAFKIPPRETLLSLPHKDKEFHYPSPTNSTDLKSVSVTDLIKAADILSTNKASEGQEKDFYSINLGAMVLNSCRAITYKNPWQRYLRQLYNCETLRKLTEDSSLESSLGAAALVTEYFLAAREKELLNEIKNAKTLPAPTFQDDLEKATDTDRLKEIVLRQEISPTAVRLALEGIE